MCASKKSIRFTLKIKTLIVAALSLFAFGGNIDTLKSSEFNFDNIKTKAIPVDNFLNSLGICIHYAQGVDPRSYVDPLLYLGIKNIRDDFGKPQGYVYLNKQTGVKSNIIASPKDLSITIEGLKYIARENALLAIEGPNEPNNFPINYKGNVGGGFQSLLGNPANWTAVANFQSDLYRAVKNDSILKYYPVFNVSEVGAQYPNLGLQFLKIPQGADVIFPAGTVFADYLNIHNYVSGTQKRYVNNQAWNAADPLLNTDWDGLFGNHGKLWGHGYSGYGSEDLLNVPKVTTETGWDSKSDFGGERVQGSVILNTYLAQFKRGWKYTFIYMLRDGEGGSGNQGVYNADSTPKQAAHYIHNLTSILSDKDVITSPQDLLYQIEQHSSTTHDLLLQTKVNEFALIIWGERTSGGEEVLIKLQSNVKSVRMYDPTLGLSAIEVSPNSNVHKVWISDHPILIKIVVDPLVSPH